MKTEKKEVVCIRLPESIKKKVDAEAKHRFLAPSKLASIIIQQYYEKTTYNETIKKLSKL